jgi:hypothetical protein
MSSQSHAGALRLPPVQRISHVNNWVATSAELAEAGKVGRGDQSYPFYFYAGPVASCYPSAVVLRKHRLLLTLR